MLLLRVLSYITSPFRPAQCCEKSLALREGISIASITCRSYLYDTVPLRAKTGVIGFEYERYILCVNVLKRDVSLELKNASLWYISCLSKVPLRFSTLRRYSLLSKLPENLNPPVIR